MEDIGKGVKMSSDKCNCGVTPIELYLRQSGKCHLVMMPSEDKYQVPTLFCTDGKEYFKAADLANPTKECSICLSSFCEIMYIELREDDGL
jgi:hypothetical protein